MNVKVSSNLKKAMSKGFDIKNPIQKSLLQSALKIQNTAKKLSPYASGNLRRSISTDTSKISKGLIFVGSDEKYARRREFENNKNPSRKFYMKRSKEQNEDDIVKLMLGAIKSVLG